ncbi:trypsin-1-like isoform X1 [Daphnia pulex]|uniref:trypsin-1-like isoform X1 n=1 Tax=Daphnia pulex TaxID=6669 RepID=UPI001EE0D78F|nr:trypsin-1-like isoform X1 [Daphnia pulex]
MSQLLQSGPATLFLVSALLSYSGPAEGGLNAKTFPSTLNDTGSEWQTPEEMEEGSNAEMRIVGSVVAQRNQYPYMVALMMFDPETEAYSQFSCGGSLISRTHALTAAHCVCVDDENEAIEIDQMVVFLGVHFINETTTDAQSRRKVRRIKIHEKYDPDLNNDIAILTLDSPVKYTKKVKPVCLPPQGSNDQYEGRMAIVKGWGATEEDGNSSQVLLHAEKAIISNSQCQEIYGEANITTRMMCAYRPGKDSCQGDSGGPMVIESNDLDENNTIKAANKPVGNRKKDCQWIQVGIVSWGDGCARKGIPGVYARVTSFLPWIKKEMTSVKSKFNFNKNQGVRNSDKQFAFIFYLIIYFIFFPLLDRLSLEQK